MGNRDVRRSVEGRGMGWGTWGIHDGHHRNFPEGKEVGWWWIIGGRRDRGFGWGTIRGGGEQLFRRPGGKNGFEQSEGVYFKGGEKEE